MRDTKLPGSDGEKALQKKFSTIQDALNFYNKQVITYLSLLMQTFIEKQEMMFISTADAKGECDASFRSGHEGFVLVLDAQHILYPEYKGNGVMASMGNINENSNIGLMFLDFFETKVGLHVNGKASIVLKEELKVALEVFPNKFDYLQNNPDLFRIVSYVLVEVEEAYIHCSIHIPMLAKVEAASCEKKFPKYAKGEDVFGVADIVRPWSKPLNDKRE